MPHWDEDLTAYTGYFSAQDTSGFHDVDFLTKVWYGGAYTVQTNTIDVNQARQNAGPLPGEQFLWISLAIDISLTRRKVGQTMPLVGQFLGPYSLMVQKETGLYRIHRFMTASHAKRNY